MASPTPIFGTSNVGIAYLTAESIAQLVTILKAAGISRIDTAARYPANAPGQSEKLLGESNVPADFIIDTKVKLLSVDGKGSLTAAAIDASIGEQLERLKVDHVGALCSSYLYGLVNSRYATNDGFIRFTPYIVTPQIQKRLWPTNWPHLIGTIEKESSNT